jgi:hypothetical protein
MNKTPLGSSKCGSTRLNHSPTAGGKAIIGTVIFLRHFIKNLSVILELLLMSIGDSRSTTKKEKALTTKS